MKIIKEGVMPSQIVVPPPKVHVSTCHHCGTIYEFNLSEGTKGCSNGVAYDFSIECPFCHRMDSKVIKYAEE